MGEEVYAGAMCVQKYATDEINPGWFVHTGVFYFIGISYEIKASGRMCRIPKR